MSCNACNRQFEHHFKSPQLALVLCLLTIVFLASCTPQRRAQRGVLQPGPVAGAATIDGLSSDGAAQTSGKIQVVTLNASQLRKLSKIWVVPLQYSTETERMPTPTKFDLERRVDEAIMQFQAVYPESPYLQSSADRPTEKALPEEDALMTFTLLNYQQPSGTRAGSVNGAHVFTEVKILNQSSKEVYYQAMYSFQEQPITENVLALGKKLRAQEEFGAGFKPAGIVFERSISELLSHVEKERVRAFQAAS